MGRKYNVGVSRMILSIIYGFGRFSCIAIMAKWLNVINIIRTAFGERNDVIRDKLLRLFTTKTNISIFVAKGLKFHFSEIASSLKLESTPTTFGIHGDFRMFFSIFINLFIYLFLIFDIMLSSMHANLFFIFDVIFLFVRIYFIFINSIKIMFFLFNIIFVSITIPFMAQNNFVFVGSCIFLQISTIFFFVGSIILSRPFSETIFTMPSFSSCWKLIHRLFFPACRTNFSYNVHIVAPPMRFGQFPGRFNVAGCLYCNMRGD